MMTMMFVLKPSQIFMFWSSSLINNILQDILSVNNSYYWCILSLGLQLLRGLSFLGSRILTSKSKYQNYECVFYFFLSAWSNHVNVQINQKKTRQLKCVFNICINHHYWLHWHLDKKGESCYRWHHKHEKKKKTVVLSFPNVIIIKKKKRKRRKL